MAERIYDVVMGAIEDGHDTEDSIVSALKGRVTRQQIRGALGALCAMQELIALDDTRRDGTKCRFAIAFPSTHKLLAASLWNPNFDASRQVCF